MATLLSSIRCCRTRYGPARAFSTTSTAFLPLQPAKQKKTIPFRHPRRPKPLDPLASGVDPDVVRVPLADREGVTLFVREPKGIAPPEQSVTGAGMGSAKTLSEETLPPFARPRTRGGEGESPKQLDLSDVAALRSLRRTSSLTTLSRKFGISRRAVSMLGWAKKDEKLEAARREEIRRTKRLGRGSVEKRLRREEKRIRRSMW